MYKLTGLLADLRHISIANFRGSELGSAGQELQVLGQ
jgi:hypothetical protein